MKTETIEIVNRGRGPQLSTTRITVMDIFYWLHRGYGWEQIRKSMPTLTRAEFDVVMDYVNQHRDELAEKDRLAEERTDRRIAEQHARGGIFAPPDENMSTEERVAQLREKMRKRIAEKNGEGNSG
jgi:uncharacterized protein (DUF433 family)